MVDCGLTPMMSTRWRYSKKNRFLCHCQLISPLRVILLTMNNEDVVYSLTALEKCRLVVSFVCQWRNTGNANHCPPPLTPNQWTLSST